MAFVTSTFLIELIRFSSWESRGVVRYQISKNRTAGECTNRVFVPKVMKHLARSSRPTIYLTGGYDRGGPAAVCQGVLFHVGWKDIFEVQFELENFERLLINLLRHPHSVGTVGTVTPIFIFIFTFIFVGTIIVVGLFHLHFDYRICLCSLLFECIAGPWLFIGGEKGPLLRVGKPHNFTRVTSRQWD